MDAMSQPFATSYQERITGFCAVEMPTTPAPKVETCNIFPAPGSLILMHANNNIFGR